MDIFWLEAVVRGSNDDGPGGSALYALALHRAPEAGERLYAMASEPGDDLAGESIFWLGEARGVEGRGVGADEAFVHRPLQPG